MWAVAQREKPRYLRALAILAVLVSAGIVFSPQKINRAAALSPVFTRPNILVDSGPGSVASAVPGGPVIATGVGGILHAAWSDNRTGEYRIYYARSTNGGQSWIGEALIDGSAGVGNQAPSIAVDTSGGVHNGNIYVAWQRNSASLADIYFTWSSDGGNTWNLRKQIDSAPLNVGSLNPRVAIDTDGTVYVAFYDLRNVFPNIDVFVARSEDGGATFFPDVQVSTGPGGDAYPCIAAYGGVVYVAWQQPNSPGTNLLLAYSTDKGNTWTVNTIVSLLVGGGDAQSVSITVDPTGAVHAAWIMMDATGNKFVAYSHSTDRGATWSTIAQVDDVPAVASYSPTSVTIVQSSSVLYAVWADNRNGTNDIFASWSEDGGATWGNGKTDNNDIRVDDTSDNAIPGDDASDQVSPSASPGPIGVYAIWADRRDFLSYHAYFAGFTVSELLITEVRDAPQGQEQVEIFNHGGVGIDLTGWDLILDGIPVSLTPLGTIAPGAYLTIGDPVSSNLVAGITLGDEGGTATLRNQLGVAVETMRYGQLGTAPDPLDAESVARVPSGGGYSNLWTRAVTPTFGSVNSVPTPRSIPPVVLNEVLFNTASPSDRFIELFFSQQGMINIGGYRLVGDAEYVLPAVILSVANPYYVIRESQAPALFSLMSPAGDNLYLYDQTGALLDMVGWSTSHTQGLSMMRIPDGFGRADGYDDASSIAAGWQFDQTPSLPLVLIGPRQSKYGDLGERIFYVLRVTNKEPADAYINIIPQPGAQGWAMSLLQANGVSPLLDSPGDADAIPDVGLLRPEASIVIQVAVDIPPTPQAQDFEYGSVTATVASDPVASANAALTTGIAPYEVPSLAVNPGAIWRSNLPPAYTPKESTVTVKVTGRGTAIFKQRPQDTILVIDATGSMAQNDPPPGLRLQAAQNYVDLLAVPDRAAVVSFNTVATLVNGHHLSSNYNQIKTDIGGITNGGGTDLVRPIRVATDEILANGNRSHVWVEIMLTDGDDTNGNTNADILAEAQRAANNGIVIFTIGLIGPGGFDEQLLMDIANMTGGIYIRAASPNDLDAVYQMIGKLVKDLAGYDNDLTDDIPMVSVFLPQNVSYVPGSANPPADYVGTSQYMTNLQWNVSTITINETWTATFGITSDRAGFAANASMYPESRVTYIRYDDTRVSVPFPQPRIDVLEPPPPIFNYTITRYPEIGMVTVDGRDYAVPAKFQWHAGENHTISAPVADNVAAGERWAFSSWDDGGLITHDIIVLASNLTITAYYYHQFKPTVRLQGLDGAHNVSAYFTAAGHSVTDPGNVNSWSDWVDERSSVVLDTLSTGSNSTERWLTQEKFAAPPWTSVTSAFNALVQYWRQVLPTLELKGLSSLHPVTVTFIQFGTSHQRPSSAAWSNWTDYHSKLSVDGQILIPPPPATAIERYMNLATKGASLLTWNVQAATAYVVPYLHQFRPTVKLIGTDQKHNVSVIFTDSMRARPTDVIHGKKGNWSDWADEGTNVTFDTYTTGSPPYKAMNNTQLFVDSAFAAYIVYAPPPPPTNETNLKPVISLIFVIALLAFGLYWGNKKPWDRYIPPPKKGLKPEELAAREAEIRKKPIAEKLAMFSLQELEEKFTKDRRWTMCMLGFPFAAVEGMIGVASLATGVLRVPEAGNWLSMGLFANTFLLIAGLAFSGVMQRHGYRVPGEAELSAFKEEDLPKRAADSRSAGKKGAASSTSEQVIGVLSAMQVWFAGFVIPRTYDLVFTDSRLVAIKSMAPLRVATGGSTPRYRTADLGTLLDEKKANFEIRYKSIEKVKIRGIVDKHLLVATQERRLDVTLPREKLNSCETVLRLSIPQYGMRLP